MAGGLFAIHKQRFKELGYYDEGIEIWGGENLELSFKQWLCGPTNDSGNSKDRILIVPCSRVGHVFRTWSPYKTNPDMVHRNNIRVAQVWMDEYKHIYYDR